MEISDTISRMLIRLVVLALAATALVPSLFSAPRLKFVRTIPAVQDLGKAEVVIAIYKADTGTKIEHFMDFFVEQTNRSSVLQADAARIAGDPDNVVLQRVQRRHPADIYIMVRNVECSMEEKAGTGSVHDPDGKRIPQRYEWVAAACRAHMDVLRGRDLTKRFSYMSKGEGQSPRVVDVTDDERNFALEQAARYTAVSASEAITPRRVRESIVLDDTAPGFHESHGLIDTYELEEVRKLWLAAARKHPQSAALQFNLGAVNEALGDLAAAQMHFQKARQMAPSEMRYQHEYKLFQRRNAGSFEPRKER